MPATKVEVLGPGCPRCQKLHENVEAAVRDLGLSCTVEKVTDMKRILAYRVLATPALVVDGEVKVSGRVPTPAEIQTLLT